MFYQEYDFLNDGSDNEGEADLDGNESSDDDDLKRVLRSIGDVQEDEDFETSMEHELADTVKSLEASRRTGAGSPSKISPMIIGSAQPVLALPEPSATNSGTNSTKAKTSSGKKSKSVKFAQEPSKFYDNDYFDSDDEDGIQAKPETIPGEKKKHPVPSDDDLFYDPDVDDEDQAWVDKERKRYQPKASTATSSAQLSLPGKKQRKSKEKGLPNSDAVLDCPACMTTLCLDCQRHEIYRQQYRAMFVKNCSVDMTQSLKYKSKNHASKKQRTASSASDETTEGDLYHPVKCAECGTEVAVLDKDEVYHFFNVLASHA